MIVVVVVVVVVEGDECKESKKKEAFGILSRRNKGSEARRGEATKEAMNQRERARACL